MKRVYCFLFAILLFFVNNNVYSGISFDHETEIVEDTSVISREYLDVIEYADSIKWYLLDPMVEDTTVLRLGDIAEILSFKMDTVSERVDLLKQTLLNPKSFVHSNMVKECTFLPDVAACIYSNNGNVYFYNSFYCDLCRFYIEEKYQEIDSELIRKTILGIVCGVFPNDRYLRNLKRREK